MGTTSRSIAIPCSRNAVMRTLDACQYNLLCAYVISYSIAESVCGCNVSAECVCRMCLPRGNGPRENSPEALENGQSMASQNGIAQSCSNGHLASISTKATTRRQDEVQARSSHGIQTRSKTSPKLNRIAPLSTATSPRYGNNTPRDDESDVASASTGRCFLTRCPEILGSLWDKAGRAGRVEVMREVIYDMIRTLRVCIVWERQEFNSETQETINPHLQSALVQIN